MHGSVPKSPNAKFSSALPPQQPPRLHHFHSRLIRHHEYVFSCTDHGICLAIPKPASGSLWCDELYKSNCVFFSSMSEHWGKPAYIMLLSSSCLIVQKGWWGCGQVSGIAKSRWQWLLQGLRCRRLPSASCSFSLRGWGQPHPKVPHAYISSPHQSSVPFSASRTVPLNTWYRLMTWNCSWNCLCTVNNSPVLTPAPGWPSASNMAHKKAFQVNSYIITDIFLYSSTYYDADIAASFF